MKLQALLVTLWLSEFQCKDYALREEYKWRVPQFKFPNASARNEALATGSYIPENNPIFAVRAWKDKVFVSVFRLRIGVASSLNYFSANCGKKSPVLIPYPSFDANYVNEDPKCQTATLPSESSIVNAGYFHIEYKCEQLWIIDSGFVQFYGDRRIVTEPAFVIFDLNTNKLIRRARIPANLVSSESSFISLVVDLKGGCCKDAYAYAVDLFRSVVVYSFKKNRSWRLLHRYFGSDPGDAYIAYEGAEYLFNFGLGGITIGDYQKDGSRRVYVNPLASTKTYYISNKILQNETYVALHNTIYVAVNNHSLDEVHVLGKRGRKVHIFNYAYDEKTNVLFDTEFNMKRIGCWNAGKQYKKSNFDIVFQGKKLFYSIDISIDENRNLWVLSNNFLKFIVEQSNPKDINTRVYKGKVDDVIAGTVCKK